MTDNQGHGPFQPPPAAADPSTPWGAGPFPAPAAPPPPPAPGVPAWGPPPASPTPARSGVGCGFAVAGLALVAAVVFLAGVLIVMASDDGGSDEVAATTAPAGAPPADAPTTTLPGGRLAPAPPEPTAEGDFTFIETEPDGDPSAWDPCDPIHYVVNSRRAPDGAMGILEQALARISEATGLVFVPDGETDEPAPVEDDFRPTEDPERYGEGVSPVLITWTDAMEDPELDTAAGLALPTSLESESGEYVYVTGYIEMGGDYAQDLIDQGRADDVLGIMMHELGHLVGLGHVTDPTEVMTDDPESTPSEWGAGDLQGLYQVGTGECVPDLP